MSGRRNLVAAHVGYMTWDPPEVHCRGCECRFDSWQAFGDHVDRLLSAPPRSRAHAVKDVLADHLGDFGSDWYDHLAAAMEDRLDSVAVEAVGGHGPDGEPGE